MAISYGLYDMEDATTTMKTFMIIDDGTENPCGQQNEDRQLKKKNKKNK